MDGSIWKMHLANLRCRLGPVMMHWIADCGGCESLDKEEAVMTV